MLADVAVGDSWNTKDGYPDFTESDGRCFCMVRTSAGDSLMNNALANGYIETKALDIKTIKQQQAYQYKRRKLEGWRLIPIQLMTGGILHFRGLAIWRQALSANVRVGFRNMRGAYKRFKSING